MREYDTVARIGGDEFAILLDTLDDVAEAETVARRVLASEFIDAGLVPGRSYSYRVRAVNTIGRSGASAGLTAATLRPPSAPPSVRSKVVSGSRVRISWIDVQGEI